MAVSVTDFTSARCSSLAAASAVSASIPPQPASMPRVPVAMSMPYRGAQASASPLLTIHVGNVISCVCSG